jgi:hypothetical protein
MRAEALSPDPATGDFSDETIACLNIAAPVPEPSLLPTGLRHCPNCREQMTMVPTVLLTPIGRSSVRSAFTFINLPVEDPVKSGNTAWPRTNSS